MAINPITGSEILRYEPGLVEVHGGRSGALLTVRRSPDDTYWVRSVELTPDEARAVGQALIDAADAAEKTR